MTKFTTAKQLFDHVKTIEKEHIQQYVDSNKELIKDREVLDKAKETFDKHTKESVEKNDKSYKTMTEFSAKHFDTLSSEEQKAYQIMMFDNSKKSQLDNLPNGLKNIKTQITSLEENIKKDQLHLSDLKTLSKTFIKDRTKKINSEYEKSIKNLK